MISNNAPMSAGGPVRHIPVALEQVISALAPRPGQLIVDATFGAGGYCQALLSMGAKIIAFDRDPQAIAAGQPLVQAAKGQLILVCAPFAELDEQLRRLGIEPPALSGIVFDIGVSSMQLDDAERGFSFRCDGPLDMRMSSAGRSAADIIESASEAELADLFYYYGEERASRRIARAIAQQRQILPFTTTKSLAEVIARANPGKPGDIHPATRCFQALRIAVNDELGQLQRGMAAGESWLQPGGHMVVVSFHSLEDRLVKRFFAERAGRGQSRSRLLPGEIATPAASFTLPKGQPILPSSPEIAVNRRARSAKLRYGQRTQGASHQLSVNPVLPRDSQ